MIHRHVKSGNLYNVLGPARIVAHNLLHDCALVVLAQNQKGEMRLLEHNSLAVSGYRVIGSCMIQTKEPLYNGTEVLIYCNITTGQLYARLQSEFNDGRFAPPFDGFDDAPVAKPRVHAVVAAEKIVDAILRDLLVTIFENDAGVERSFEEYKFRARDFVVRTLNGEIEEPATRFKRGDPVQKVGGDYTFEGIVVSVFPKLSGQERYVVEDDRGVLHVYSEKNLTDAPERVSKSLRFPVGGNRMITQGMVDEALGNAELNADPEFFAQTSLAIAVDMATCSSDFELCDPESIVAMIDNWKARHGYST